MGVRLFNGLQIEVPDSWADTSTVVLAPRPEVEGEKPSLNLVVKRRPSKADETERTMLEYLRFMKATFGELHDLNAKEMMAGSIRGRATRFSATTEGRKFQQTTFIYFASGEEISATVTQVEGDSTPPAEVEKLLRSVRPAAAGVRGLR